VKALLAQTRMELRLMARRGESLLVTLGIPLGLLLFLGSTPAFSFGGRNAIDFLVPSLLALAIMSKSLVSLGIATAYERHYGVLKRLGGTPLARWQLVGAKLASIAVIQAVQAVLLLGTAATVFGWRPAGGAGWAVAAAGLGTAAFAGLGLLMAGALRAEAVLAAANGLYLLLLLFGGIVIPLEELPAALANVGPYLPSAALADLLRAALAGGPPPVSSAAILTVWAVGALSLTVLTFRWE
jgi:ABC-2 type transport system permease protein